MNQLLHYAHEAAVFLATAENQEYDFDPNQVSPGPIGFAFIGLLAVAAILLSFPLVRSLRNYSYRAQIQEDIARELAERDAQAAADKKPEQPES